MASKISRRFEIVGFYFVLVNTPEDAFNCFMGTELDILAIGNCYLNKEDQDKSLKKDYKIKYELD